MKHPIAALVRPALTLSALALAAATAAPAQTTSAPYLDPAELDRAVATFAGMPGQPVDRRLRLTPCPQPLAAEWYGAEQRTVQLRCPVRGGWRLFVPLAATGAVAAPEPPAITRGDVVALVVAGDGFAVSQAGEALESGAIGSWIRVRLGSEKPAVVRGRVLGTGKVGIDLP